jgi:hypothetical protein
MFNIENFYFGNTVEQKHWIKVYTTIIIKIVLSLISVNLAWQCNKNSGIVMQIIISLIAFVFSEIYILYYAVYRVFMGNKCY